METATDYTNKFISTHNLHFEFTKAYFVITHFLPNVHNRVSQGKLVYGFVSTPLRFTLKKTRNKFHFFSLAFIK